MEVCAGYDYYYYYDNCYEGKGDIAIERIGVDRFKGVAAHDWLEVSIVLRFEVTGILRPLAYPNLLLVEEENYEPVSPATAAIELNLA